LSIISNDVHVHKVGYTYPVGVVAMVVKSCAEYMAATETMKDVKKPSDHVLSKALGTASLAFVASSARCIAPSRPPYM
jgi:hypothetical protein